MTRPAPISWLDLERYALGALPADAQTAVEAAVRADAETAQRLQAIQDDLRPVPALPAELPADSGLPLPSAPPLSLAPAHRPARWRLPAGVGATLLAAATALWVVRAPSSPALPPAITRYKGGELSLTVDRARGDATARAVTTFRDGDRLQLRLTCAPGDRPWRAAIFQGGAVAAPLTATQPLACGNQVPLPGAVVVDGADLVACVAVDGAHPLGSLPPGDVPGVVCQALAQETTPSP